ncbi:BTB/POZ domain-containing protein 6-like [Saccostrea echinata]|uniref:BTB/POZ domain-containing protein 6-like n=1 Tax=Saccostrea echinata TaxID=191078 RepID=UPI002A8406B8|nr:BTB/POZ domain-containing protein 6-like [Saccostrea echinata]
MMEMDQSSNNWQAGKKVLECNKYMLTNQIQCDVTFKVGAEEKDVRAHRYVLGSRSSVFYAMLFGSLSDNANDIIVPDIEHNIFQVLLRFLYYEETNINEDTVLGILYAAEKYGVTNLKDICNSYLENHIGEESVCTIMENAKLFNLNDLLTKCIDFIVQSDATTKTVFESQDFLGLNRECFAALIQLDNLPVNEEFLYKSLVLWSHRNCEKEGRDVNNPENIRSMMGDLLYHVRFPLMSLETFWMVAGDNILTYQEKNQISKFIFGLSVENKLLFPANQRRKNISIYRGTDYQPFWRFYGKIDALKFRVNKSVYMRGLILLGSCEKVPYTYTIEVKVINSDNKTVCWFLEQPVTNSDKEFQVIFDEHCLLEANQDYIIWLRMFGSKSYRMKQCRSLVIEDDVQVTFSNSELCTNGTNGSRGQIPGFLCSIPL